MKSRGNKPSILETIGKRVELRKAGRDFKGLCPFHSEKTPSFSVNEEKGVFHCHGCQASGDVIDCIMRLDGLLFPDACKMLIIDTTGARPASRLTASRKRAAELAAAWVNEQRAKLNVMIADSLERRDIADEANEFDQAEIFDRELMMLRGFYDALGYPRGVAEMLAVREAIEGITAVAEMTL